MRGAVKVDLNPDAFVASVPHDTFDWLRAHEPVYLFEDAEGRTFWNLTRCKEVVYASRHFDIFTSSRGTNVEDPQGGAELMLINMDPPSHTKLRTLVSKGFNPKVIGGLEPHVRDVARSIIDRVAAKGECDFVEEVAAELPLEVICELIGIPLEDRHQIFEWSNTMIGFDDPEYGTDLDKATKAALAMYAYCDRLASGRRERPNQDLISTLVQAEVDGERLTDFEIDVFFLLLAVAGNETTRNLISGGMLALTENPDQQARLAKDPSLIPCAVEEMLRWVTPVMHFRRTATQDVEMCGKTIHEGEKVLLWYISANRDSHLFEEPHRFDVERSPNQHVTFGGGGPHFCLGFALAQQEIRVMFEQLMSRIPDIEPAGPVSRLRSNFINGIKHMPVTFNPQKAG